MTFCPTSEYSVQKASTYAVINLNQVVGFFGNLQHPFFDKIFICIERYRLVYLTFEFESARISNVTMQCVEYCSLTSLECLRKHEQTHAYLCDTAAG